MSTINKDDSLKHNPVVSFMGFLPLSFTGSWPVMKGLRSASLYACDNPPLDGLDRPWLIPMRPYIAIDYELIIELLPFRFYCWKLYKTIFLFEQAITLILNAFDTTPSMEPCMAMALMLLDSISSFLQASSPTRRVLLAVFLYFYNEIYKA